MKSQDLWKQLKKGDRNALELLFCKHYDDLFRYAVKFCGNEVIAEDHIQNLFLRIWKKRTSLGDVTGVKTYLWTALRRSLIQQNHRETRRTEIYDKAGEEIYFRKFHAEEIIIREERGREKREALNMALDELTPRQREIIYLRYFEGMTYDELESITSLSYQTLRNYVYEALKVLDEVMINDKSGISLTAVGLLILITQLSSNLI